MTSFEEYTDQFGCHFNKKLYEWAVSMMRDRNGNPVQPKPKEFVTEFLKNHGVTLENDKGYDAPYVFHMGRADYYGSSITDDAHLALYVKDFLDDRDGTTTKAFDHFVVDCRQKGEPIFWDTLM